MAWTRSGWALGVACWGLVGCDATQAAVDAGSSARGLGAGPPAASLTAPSAVRSPEVDAAVSSPDADESTEASDADVKQPGAARTCGAKGAACCKDSAGATCQGALRCCGGRCAEHCAPRGSCDVVCTGAPPELKVRLACAAQRSEEACRALQTGGFPATCRWVTASTRPCPALP